MQRHLHYTLKRHKILCALNLVLTPAIITAIAEATQMHFVREACTTRDPTRTTNHHEWACRLVARNYRSEETTIRQNRVYQRLIDL